MVTASRRQFLQGVALAPLALSSAKSSAVSTAVPSIPQRLRPGDTVALVAPAGVTYEKDYVTTAQQSLEALGLKVVLGKHILNRFGYLAGEDRERAADINWAFADSQIHGIFCLRGGWGAARLLPFLDYSMIRRNPKVFMGYSDITTLLNALYSKSNLVTFHGPTGGSPWFDFSVEKMRRLVFDGKAITMESHTRREGTLAPRLNRIQTIVPGKAKGKLVGGNLSLLANLVGTPYFPDVSGHLLLIEEIGEYIYRCDRMLTQLSNAGIFDDVTGVVFGSFTDCDVDPSGGYGTFSLMDIFNHHLGHRSKPAYFGALFGHIDEKYTLPIGVSAEMDADRGTLRLLTPAVQGVNT